MDKFSGELLERATDSDYLAKRLAMNKNFQLYDFSQWALEQIRPKVGDRVLEVGCGRGAQTIPVSEVVGFHGAITFIDLSKASVDHVSACIGDSTRARGIHGSMDEIARLLGEVGQGYDLAYSVYALYYADDPAGVLNEMYQRLASGGRLCIIGPDAPHGLVEIARKYHHIPAQVDNGFKFRSTIVEPFFKKNFAKFEILFLKNQQTIASAEQFIEFYRQTTYYDSDAEASLRLYVENQINEHGQLVFDKYSYAVAGQKI